MENALPSPELCIQLLNNEQSKMQCLSTSSRSSHVQARRTQTPYVRGGPLMALPRVTEGKDTHSAAEINRRELVLNSVNVLVLGALFNIGGAPRPKGLGIQDYGGGVKTLALCPSTPNCVSTAEEANDPNHFIPPWTYNPQDGRGRKAPASRAEAMAELRAVVEKLQPDGFTPKIVQETEDFLYVEYTSPLLGFIDDVEFWFKPGPGSRVEYRSASRLGESDGNINRKRIRAIRQELEKKGWASVGY